MSDKIQKLKPDKIRKRVVPGKTVCTLEERKNYATMIKTVHIVA